MSVKLDLRMAGRWALSFYSQRLTLFNAYDKLNYHRDLNPERLGTFLVPLAISATSC